MTKDEAIDALRERGYGEHEIEDIFEALGIEDIPAIDQPLLFNGVCYADEHH